jgi:hypothetical protein
VTVWGDFKSVETAIVENHHASGHEKNDANFSLEKAFDAPYL